MTPEWRNAILLLAGLIVVATVILFAALREAVSLLKIISHQMDCLGTLVAEIDQEVTKHRQEQA